jgi:two-component system response regulator CpxR
MLRFYCRCGFPFWVTARGTGSTLDLLVFDGRSAPEQTRIPLQQCPQCHVHLSPEDGEGTPLPLASSAPTLPDHAPESPPSAFSSDVLQLPSAGVPQESQESPLERVQMKRLLTQGDPIPKHRSPWGVLVVDDDREFREVLQQGLQSEGFRVASARDGVEAVARLRREPGDWIILLDLLMPRMDGWAVLHQLLANGTEFGDQKVVLMSASWMLAQEGPPWRSPQVVAALSKPFDLDHLLAVLAHLTGASSGNSP